MLKGYWFNIFAKVVYGLILPLGLLSVALFGHYSLARERQILEWREKMSDSLDQISKYHEDDRFFHGMLQTGFRASDRAKKPMDACRQRIGSLKKQFPDMLRFVVYDTAGRVVSDLSDEKRFQYVFRAMYQVITSVREHVAEVIIPYPDRLAEVRSRITLLRGFFGQFLMEKHLSLPLLEGYLGSCIRACEEPEKSLLWYQQYDNFTIIAFVHRDLLMRDIGPRLMVDSFNHRNEVCRLGLFDTQKLTIYGVKEQHNEIIMQANAYSNSAVEFVRSDDYLLFFRQISPRLIAFSKVNKAENLINPDLAVTEFMFRLVRWLLIAAFVIYCLSLRSVNFVLSVRQKLLLLFLFANGLPMLILAATAYEFFDQKKSLLINAAHEESVRVIKEFDNGYPDGREKMARRLSVYIKEKNRQYGNQVWPEEEIEKLKNFVLTFKPGETYLFSRAGEQLMYAGSEAFSSSAKIIRDFFKGCLDFFNNADPNFVSNKRSLLEKMTEDAYLYDGVLRHIGNISPQNFGSGLRWTYLELLGARQNHDSWGFLVISWRSSDLQRAFLSEQLDEVNTRIAPRQLIVMEKGSEVVFPVRMAHERAVRNIMHRTQTRKLITENSLNVENKRYVATSLVGIELSDAVIMAVYPNSLIFAEIDLLYRKVVLAGFLSLLMVLVIVRFFSGRLLLPITALSRGMRSLARRDFKYRIDFSSGDEFGKLTAAFNETIAGMNELAIGTAVQESLLSPGKERFGNIKLFARSIFMSKMGGDYYDYFKIDDQRFGVYFGDVAGHGIPAALVMAMAKAVVAASPSRNVGPAALLQSANEVFLHLKAKGWRRMMTALCLDVNQQNGQFRISNAGQCYPVIISASHAEVNYVKAVGMPLGSASRKPYSEMSGQLVPGDTLILYTDGIIEATNADEEVFDFAGFEKLLLASWHPDLETWWEGIYKGYCGWTEAQDDDITFLMLKYEND
ncbi:MAG: SpoIIE family protein phosphatase [Candidatus Riflebacteria bacterium]|nr:SpoIIE family protein phosphatase [Candidatus Riflebacteria bacterium]